MPGDEIDLEDYDYFIEELQELIKDAPSAMQARFAKVIIFLRQKRTSFKQSLNSFIRVEDQKKEIDFSQMLLFLEDKMKNSPNQEERYSTALKIAQTREKMKENEKEDAEKKKTDQQSGDTTKEKSTEPELTELLNIKKSKELKSQEIIVSTEPKKIQEIKIENTPKIEVQEKKEIQPSINSDIPQKIEENVEKTPVVSQVQDMTDNKEKIENTTLNVEKTQETDLLIKEILGTNIEPVNLPPERPIQQEIKNETSEVKTTEKDVKQLKKGIVILNKNLEDRMEESLAKGIDLFSFTDEAVEEGYLVKVEVDMVKYKEMNLDLGVKENKEDGKTIIHAISKTDDDELTPFAEFKEVRQIPLDVVKTQEKLIKPPPEPDYLKSMSKFAESEKKKEEASKEIHIEKEIEQPMEPSVTDENIGEEKSTEPKQIAVNDLEIEVKQKEVEDILKDGNKEEKTAIVKNKQELTEKQIKRIQKIKHGQRNRIKNKDTPKRLSKIKRPDRFEMKKSKYFRSKLYRSGKHN